MMMMGKPRSHTFKRPKTPPLVSASGQINKRVFDSQSPSQNPAKRFKAAPSNTTSLIGINKSMVAARDPIKQALMECAKSKFYQEYTKKVSEKKKEREAQINLEKMKENADLDEQEKQRKEKTERDRVDERIKLDSMKPNLDLEPSWCTLHSLLQTLEGFDVASWKGITYTPYHQYH